MTEISWQAKCLSFLRGMNSGQDWQPAHTQMYGLVLEVLGEQVGTQTVQWAVLNEEWRPSPARLRQIAARLASPYPDSEETYAEILHKAQTLGVYGQPHPERPNIRLEGPPPFSHPLVAQVVAHCGSWAAICTGESNMAEGLKKQVRSSHESCAARWEQEVTKQLSLPADRRERRYFPRWSRYELPCGWTEEETTPALAPVEKRVEYAEMPPDVRRMIDGLAVGKGMNGR